MLEYVGEIMGGQNNNQWPNGRNQYGITKEDTKGLHEQVIETIRVGYLFKPTHSEVHFVK
jgi:hypothetical protein